MNNDKLQNRVLQLIKYDVFICGNEEALINLLSKINDELLIEYLGYYDTEDEVA